MLKTQNSELKLKWPNQTNRFMNKCEWFENHIGERMKRQCDDASNQKTLTKPLFFKLTSKPCFYNVIFIKIELY